MFRGVGKAEKSVSLKIKYIFYWEAILISKCYKTLSYIFRPVGTFKFHEKL